MESLFARNKHKHHELTLHLSTRRENQLTVTTEPKLNASSRT